MLNQPTILTLLDANQSQLKAYGVKRLGLFGSFVREEAGAEAECLYLISFTDKLQQAEFLQSPTLRRAFVCSLEIIGEATKHIPDHVRQLHSTVDWRAIAGMRERLIYAYFDVDDELVWDGVINKIPPLKDEAVRMIGLAYNLVQDNEVNG